METAQSQILSSDTARIIAENFIEKIPCCPAGYEGKGIVIPGGGVSYFVNAWVCVNMLRHLGCTLPIQIWYLGQKEIDQRMKTLIEPLEVECVDAQEIRKIHPARILNGWELKPYSIIHCPFNEVLLLDADNVPVKDPEYLYNTSQYKETGAIFWPDYNRLGPEREIWEICGVEYRDEPEFESGQIVVNKGKCWEALSLTMWYNEHSDFYYQYIHGDKDTFHMAFKKLNKPYAMTDWPICPLDGTMCQHDFKGNRIFQHRNMVKWNFDGDNRRVEDFLYEKECRIFLDKLRILWCGSIAHNNKIDFLPKQETEQLAEKWLVKMVYEYHRVGYDCRSMCFLPDGTIGMGAAGCEKYWEIKEDHVNTILEISSENDLTCVLTLDKKGIWKGKWLRFEQMPIELTPLSEITYHKDCSYINLFAPYSGKRDSFISVLKYLYKLKLDRTIIVEFGTHRGSQICTRESDGWSTVFWGWYAQNFNAEVYTVDVSKNHIEVCKQRTKDYAQNINYHVEDGIQFLRNFTKPITLIYFDAWDYGIPNSEEKHLEAYLSIEQKPEIILIDDVYDDEIYEGKGKLLIQHAIADGYEKLFYINSQVCLVKGLKK